MTGAFLLLQTEGILLLSFFHFFFLIACGFFFLLGAGYQGAVVQILWWSLSRRCNSGANEQNRARPKSEGLEVGLGRFESGAAGFYIRLQVGHTGVLTRTTVRTRPVFPTQTFTCFDTASPTLFKMQNGRVHKHYSKAECSPSNQTHQRAQNEKGKEKINIPLLCSACRCEDKKKKKLFTSRTGKKKCPFCAFVVKIGFLIEKRKASHFDRPIRCVIA